MQCFDKFAKSPKINLLPLYLRPILPFEWFLSSTRSMQTFIFSRYDWSLAMVGLLSKGRLRRTEQTQHHLSSPAHTPNELKQMNIKLFLLMIFQWSILYANLSLNQYTVLTIRNQCSRSYRYPFIQSQSYLAWCLNGCSRAHARLKYDLSFEFRLQWRFLDKGFFIKLNCLSFLPVMI